jgi:hypothetical protein
MPCGYIMGNLSNEKKTYINNYCLKESMLAKIDDCSFTGSYTQRSLFKLAVKVSPIISAEKVKASEKLFPALI